MRICAVGCTPRYIEPTVLDYGTDLAQFKACEAMQDENFGPIVPAVRFQDVEQVPELEPQTVHSLLHVAAATLAMPTMPTMPIMPVTASR